MLPSGLLLAGLCLAAILLWTHQPGNRPARPAELHTGDARFVKTPDTSALYYDVAGSDPAEIRAAIRRSGPRDQSDGKAMSARSNWYIWWRWPLRSTGECDLPNVRMMFRATIILPRLENEETLPLNVRSEWDRFISSLELHEAGHVRHAYEHLDDVKQAILASTCERANADGMAALRRLNAFDIEYDRDTRHGATQGATLR